MGWAAGDCAPCAAATTHEVKQLRREAQNLKEVVAEQGLELRLLQKSMIGDGEDHRRGSPHLEAEIIDLVEQSHLPTRRTLQMLGIKPSTFSLDGRLSRGEEDNGPEAAMGCRGRRQSLFGRRAHQRDGVAMANKFRQLPRKTNHDAPDRPFSRGLFLKAGDDRCDNKYDHNGPLDNCDYGAIRTRSKD